MRWCVNFCGKAERLVRGKHNRKEIEWEATPTAVCVVSSLVWSFRWFPLFSCRQCALVALEDVKAYFTKESGQIAVSLSTSPSLPLSLRPGYLSPPGVSLGHCFIFLLLLIYFVCFLPRCLMLPIPLGRGGTWFWILLSRMPSRWADSMLEEKGWVRWGARMERWECWSLWWAQD